MIKLKPCPFCGKEVEIVYVGGGWFWRHKIEPPLPTCPITHSRKYSTYEEAAKSWNKRSTKKERKGLWQRAKGQIDKRNNFYKCSECGRTINLECGNTLSDFPYCHCGAKMDGERRDT